MEHLPVLENEVVEFLKPKRGGTIVDCTLGLGGHALRIIPKLGKSGSYIGFDLDEKNLSEADRRLEKYGGQVTLVKRNFRYLSDELLKLGFDQVDGILLDLGLSSPHVDDPSRGFSFREEGELDMRYDRNSGKSAYDVVNHYSDEELIKIFREYGEERMARRIAGAIVEARKIAPLRTTKELSELIGSVVGGKPRIDPSTRVFQALRIEVNDEIGALKDVLPQAFSHLKKGGRLVVISYHSLEDRIVKHFFKDESRECICSKEIPICVCNHKPTLKILTKKPLTPAPEEIERNRRARSAKLRAIEKL